MATAAPGTRPSGILRLRVRDGIDSVVFSKFAKFAVHRLGYGSIFAAENAGSDALYGHQLAKVTYP